MYFIICITALLASLMTLISGFGLSTLLVPVFALIFSCASRNRCCCNCSSLDQFISNGAYGKICQ